jgi:hypothetical protein
MEFVKERVVTLEKKTTEARLSLDVRLRYGALQLFFLSFYHGHMAFGLVQVIACVRVHSLAVWMAAGSSSFQRWATSLASGSSGLGAPRRA